ncbi:MAG TPA: helix-turn-helix transcriptional regulator [Pirellulales bacterium]|nr:helix-turn-helix transcriptional regulator [Pirellulales bacterium]
MTAGQSIDWGDQLKAAIAASGRSVNELAKAAGVPQPVLQRFVSGSQDSIRLDTANKLGDVLGLTLVANSSKRVPKKSLKRRRPG